MNEMARAFVFKLVGEENVSGHPAFVLDATPNPAYRPINRETRVLTGMKGRLWVDREQFHWPKLEAEVVKPVSFHLIAKVGPGTRFVLEKEPVAAGVWQPRRFAVQVEASVMWFQRNSSKEETFSDYRAGDPLERSVMRGDFGAGAIREFGDARGGPLRCDSVQQRRGECIARAHPDRQAGSAAAPLQRILRREAERIRLAPRVTQTAS